MERKWLTLIVVCVAVFMLLLDITIVNVALPDIGRSLHADFSDLQWVVDAYSLTLAALLLTAGSLGDLLGRRRIFIVGLAIFSLASLACGLPNSLDAEPDARRAGHRRGRDVRHIARAHRDSFQGRERGTAFGIWGATVGASAAVGPLIGGVLTESAGWEWVFFVNVPSASSPIVAGPPLHLREPRPRRARHRLARAVHVLGRPVPARVRADPRQRGGLGHHHDRGRCCRRRCCCWSRSSSSSRGCPTRCSTSPCSACRRSSGRRSRPSGCRPRCSRCSCTSRSTSRTACTTRRCRPACASCPSP